MPNAKIHSFHTGIAKGVPIIIGYLPIALSYGILATQAGIPLFHTVLMSILVYAGASQFVAVNMVALGATSIEIILTTFVLNFRHFVMSMSWVHRYTKFPLPWKASLTYWLTDETFAVSMLHTNENRATDGPYYHLGLMVSAYSSWVLGSLGGGLLASIIPPDIGASMSMGLYAMFIGLLLPAVRSNWKLGLVAAVAAVLGTILNNVIDIGWAIVLATIAAAFIGVLITDDEQ